MPDYTKLMYDAAERLYEEIGERHGYSGLCAGLSAVAKDLGIDLDRWYWSHRHHDPLSGFHNEFALGRITFEDLVRGWDMMWFGHGTGSLRPIEHPFSEIGRSFPSRWRSTMDVGWIERQVTSYLREKKIRRGTRAHQAFVRENARRVVDEATRVSTIKARTLADQLRADEKKAVELRARAAAVMTRLEEEAELRRRLLAAAGLAGAPLTDAEFSHQGTSWGRALEQLDHQVEHLREAARQAESPDEIEEEALIALEHSPALAPFPAALGLVSHASMRNPRAARSS